MHRPLISTILATAAALPAAAEDWPRFLGPRLDAITQAPDVQLEWDQPIPLVWERTIGAAFSSFAIVDGRLYTCGTNDRQQVLVCLDATDGAPRWSTPIESAYQERQGGDGARATPAVEGGRVYVMGALGRVVCASADSGEVIWSRTYNHAPRWGYSGSVLIEGDLAVISPGGADGALVALDRSTGEPRWSAGDATAGYATPYPFTHDGRRYIAGFVADGLLIVDAASGAQAARVPWKTDWDVNAATPIYHEGQLWIGSGYSTGSALYNVRSAGERLELEQVWMQPEMLAKFQSPVLFEGHLYLSDQQRLKCFAWATGEERWSAHRTESGRTIKDSTLMLVNGHLLVQCESGDLLIAPAAPAGFEPVTQAKILDGRCWTLPVVWGGKLYSRNLERVVCFDLTGR